MRKDKTLELFGKTFRQLFLLAEAPTTEMQVALLRLALREVELMHYTGRLAAGNDG